MAGDRRERALSELLLAAVFERFGDGALRVGTPPAPLVIFPAKHPDVGDVSIRTGTMRVNIAIGDILVDDFTSYDTHLDQAERVERLTSDVVRFLRELFTDRLLFWASTDKRKRGWRERGDVGYSEPLVLDDRTYRMYLWSGPLPLWRATPAILARGRIETDREYQILLTRLDGTTDDRETPELEQVRQLVKEYEARGGGT